MLVLVLGVPVGAGLELSMGKTDRRGLVEQVWVAAVRWKGQMDQCSVGGVVVRVVRWFRVL